MIELDRFDEALEHLSHTVLETLCELDHLEMDSAVINLCGFLFIAGKTLYKAGKHKNALNCLQISLGIALSLK